MTGSSPMVTLELFTVGGPLRWMYLLEGSGTMPGDLESQFVSGASQTVYINGRFTVVSQSSRVARVTDFSVARLTEPCPVSR
jgi:hypothetical protein